MPGHQGAALSRRVRAVLKIPEAYRHEFEEEIAEKLVLGAQTGCLVVIVLFPLFGILDFVLYPEQARRMSLIRLVLTSSQIVNLLIQRRLVKADRVRPWIRPLTWAILYPTIFALDAIIILAGGANSPYYAGLSLVLLGMMVMAPWGFGEMLVHALAIWSQYALLMVAIGAEPFDWRIYLSNNYFMLAILIIGLAWTYQAHELRIKEFLARKELSHEKERSEQLLLNILPAEVADELMRKGHVEARSCPSATILFTDFAGFTSISNRIPASALVQSLHRLFTGFDGIITRHNLEKLKTIGDAYMCVGGLPTERPGHLISAVLASLEIIDFLERDSAAIGQADVAWKARIGIHHGPVIAGVIGNRKFAYDVWGDTVNLASRLETASEPGRINITSSTFKQISHLFVGTDRGILPVKGKGPVSMTFVDRIRSDLSLDEKGYFPNERFWQVVRMQEKLADVGKAFANQVVERPRVVEMRQAMERHLWSQLKGLTDADVHKLGKIGTQFEFGTGTKLLTQGEPVSALMVVIEGHVAVRIHGEETKIDVSVLGPGDLMGEMSFVTGEAASASVVAIESGKALSLSRKALEAAVKDDMGFAARFHLALAGLMAERLRETTTRLPPLIVEDVAHTRLHHSMITGRAGSDTVPPVLSDAVETFKEGMRQLDRTLLRSPEVTEEHRVQVKSLCDLLKDGLSTGLAEVADRGQAFQDGVASYVLRETFPYFMLSRMIDRSFSKPRGYAGDYYTIELIHLFEPRGDRKLGPLIDWEYLQSPPCQAVRNRRFLMVDLLKEVHRNREDTGEPFLLTSLAAGAGREALDFMGSLPAPEKVFASLLDIDVEALTYSSHLAAEVGLQDRVLFAKENVLHLVLGRGRTRLPPQDIIYSIGLADYLKDRVIVRLLNWIHSSLKPGGVAVVGNFGTSNPDRDFMDHVLDWRLYHRTPDDMRRLFAESSFGSAPVEVRVEPAGINLMAMARRLS